MCLDGVPHSCVGNKPEVIPMTSIPCLWTEDSLMPLQAAQRLSEYCLHLGSHMQTGKSYY
jgi:hypothetical protein